MSLDMFFRCEVTYIYIYTYICYIHTANMIIYLFLCVYNISYRLTYCKWSISLHIGRLVLFCMCAHGSVNHLLSLSKKYHETDWQCTHGGSGMWWTSCYMWLLPGRRLKASCKLQCTWRASLSLVGVGCVQDRKEYDGEIEC